MPNKRKNGQMELHTIKKLLHKKEMVSKLKRPLTEWEKIFAIYSSGKGLIIRIYRGIRKVNSPKINEPIKKWANELNRTFSKEEIHMAKKHKKKCSPSLATMEM
jgi:predicted RNase H-like nuclease (RuvC/YqgF family)